MFITNDIPLSVVFLFDDVCVVDVDVVVVDVVVGMKIVVVIISSQLGP